MRFSSTAPSAATPTATPVRRQALLIPEAMPVRDGSTARSAAAAIAGLARPIPIPATIRPGSSAVQLELGVSAVHQEQRDRDEHQAAGEHPAQRRARRELAHQQRHDEDEDRQRQEAQARRRAASSRGCPAGRSRGTGRARTSRRRSRTSPARRRRTRRCGRGQVEHRPRLPVLDRDEDEQQHGPADQRAEDQRARPALVVAAQHAEDDQEERAREGEQAPDVGARRLRVARLAHPGHRDHERE